MAQPTQYTDAQIKEYMGYVRDASAGKYTPDQLKEYEQYIRDMAGPDAPGFKADSPAETDLYGNDANRLMAGFGDPAGIAKKGLLAPGYSVPKKNASGDLVTQGPDGKWYKDATSITKHPMNWLESAMGGAPSTAGMMLGGAMGGPLAIPMAGLGGAAGEAVRQDVGRLGGVYQGDNANSDLSDQGMGGALGELGGKIVGKIAKPVLAPAAAWGSDKFSKILSALSGVDASDILRTIQKRAAVFKPKSSQDIAKSMADELADTHESESAIHKVASDAFDQSMGDRAVPTETLLEQGQADLNRRGNAPSPAGEGNLTPGEHSELSARQRRNLVTPSIEATPVQPSLTYGEPTTQMVDPYYSNIPVQVSTVDRGLEKSGDPITIQPEKSEAKLRDLLAYAKGLGADVGRKFDRSGLPVDRTAGSVSFMEREYGRTKDLIHGYSTDLGAADTRFNDYAKKSDLLKPVTNEATQQGFLDSLVDSSKKDNARDAASDLVPKSYGDALDLGANRAWGKTPTDMVRAVGTARLMTQLGLGAAAGVGSHEGQSPWITVPEVAAATAMSPAAQYGMIRAGIPLLKQIPAAIGKSVVKRFSPFNVEDPNSFQEK